VGGRCRPSRHVHTGMVPRSAPERPARTHPSAGKVNSQKKSGTMTIRAKVMMLGRVQRVPVYLARSCRVREGVGFLGATPCPGATMETDLAGGSRNAVQEHFLIQ